jgi:hypothetical protein
MLKRSFRSEKEFREFFFGENAERELIYDYIVECIDVAVSKGESTAHFATITIEGDEMDINCQRPEFRDNLQNALNFYIDNEIYEKCDNV